ncbi:RNA polymerase sigma factor [Demequina aestuarii]|uniref:RNA polymerase sigma factor n=1 Tax=Demequina aestuarii TaxID=327095 RepID=UPI000A03677B|nr:sigma-70 family RNA polymerase sigma factor [Demequina aestuarii]
MERNNELCDGHLGARPQAPSDSAVRFEQLWDSYAHRISAYAARHVGPEVAQEIVAETFLVVWRRLDDVPPEPLPWLIVVARNTISVARRTERRAQNLESVLARLAEVAAPAASDPEDVVVEREAMLLGMASLTEVEREALLLTAWDGLGAAQAALVVGCSTTAFHVRLHRARKRIASLIHASERFAPTKPLAGASAERPDEPPTPPSPEPPTGPLTTPRLSWRNQ